ncbi:MAG: DUF86 domain-containing protein [Thermoflexales bacterium]
MDDVVAEKVSSLQRCVLRAREEYRLAGKTFARNFTRQDAAILNIVRACELAIDLASYTVRQKRLGIPGTSAEAFEMLKAAVIIDEGLCERMVRMVGFRNLVIHAYRKIDLTIVVIVIVERLNDVITFGDRILGLSD